MENTKELKKQLQKRNFYTIRDGGLVYFYALILPLTLGLIFSYLVVSIAASNGVTAGEGESILQVLFDKYLWFAILTTMLTQIVFALIYLCYHKLNRISFSASKVSFKKAKWQSVCLSAFVGIFCVCGFILLIECCLGSFFDVIGVKTSGVALPLNTPAWLVVNLLILGVVPAICEELLFRGVVYQGLREKFGVTTSVLLSGLLFALIHQNIVQFVYPFLLGCVLSVVLEKTNNLLYCMIIHMFNNFATIILSYLAEIGTIHFNFSITWWFVLISILIAAFASVVLWLLYRFYLKKHERVEVQREGELVQSVPLSVKKLPVTILSSIIIAVMIIVLNAVL